MKTITILIALFAGCGAIDSTDRPAAPYVMLELVHETPPLPEYLRGAGVWEPLGFDFGYTDSGLPECQPNWYQPGQVTDCQITITLVRWEHLQEQEGTTALSDRHLRTMAIDTREEGSSLQLATAHEVGHIILNTEAHTMGGVMGGASLTLTATDIEFACAHIHICI